MNNFKINENDLIEKIFDDKFEKLVIIGKNGVGKTHFAENLVKKIELSQKKAYFIKASLDIDKEIKNLKDTNLKKISSLLNELTNFVYKIDQKILYEYFKNNEDFNKFCEKNDLLFKKIDEWFKNIFINEKLIIDSEDPDLKAINVNEPNLNISTVFELNYNKKMNMGNIFSSISEEAGTGQYFYTILKLINNILEFCSETQNKYMYFIIDEPEKFCHPELIIKIANSLRNINNKILKVICISHSNIFVNNFINKLDEVILLTGKNEFWQYNEKLFLEKLNPFFKKGASLNKEFDNCSYSKIKQRSLSFGKLVDVYKKGINSWFNYWPLNNELINSLFYSEIVVCEGLNDEYLLKSLNLKNNIFILKSFGKFEIPFLNTLLKLFNKKVFTIYDSDISSSNNNSNNEWINFWLKINSLMHNYCLFNECNSFVFKNNLESYLKLEGSDKDYLTRLNLFFNNKNIQSDSLERFNLLKKELSSKINSFFWK